MDGFYEYLKENGFDTDGLDGFMLPQGKPGVDINVTRLNEFSNSFTDPECCLAILKLDERTILKRMYYDEHLDSNIGYRKNAVILNTDGTVPLQRLVLVFMLCGLKRKWNFFFSYSVLEGFDVEWFCKNLEYVVTEISKTRIIIKILMMDNDVLHIAVAKRFANTVTSGIILDLLIANTVIFNGYCLVHSLGDLCEFIRNQKGIVPGNLPHIKVIDYVVEFKSNLTLMSLNDYKTNLKNVSKYGISQYPLPGYKFILNNRIYVALLSLKHDIEQGLVNPPDLVINKLQDTIDFFKNVLKLITLTEPDTLASYADRDEFFELCKIFNNYAIHASKLSNKVKCVENITSTLSAITKLIHRHHAIRMDVFNNNDLEDILRLTSKRDCSISSCSINTAKILVESSSVAAVILHKRGLSETLKALHLLLSYNVQQKTRIEIKAYRAALNNEVFILQGMSFFASEFHCNECATFFYDAKISSFLAYVIMDFFKRYISICKVTPLSQSCLDRIFVEILHDESLEIDESVVAWINDNVNHKTIFFKFLLRRLFEEANDREFNQIPL